MIAIIIDACAHPWSLHDSDPTSNQFTKNIKIKISYHFSLLLEMLELIHTNTVYVVSSPYVGVNL
jgi:hypothetical protein